MKKFGNLTVYENLKEIVEPQHTALVVWDPLVELGERIFNKDEFVNNLMQFMTTARKNKVPIVYARTAVPPLQVESSWRLYKYMKDFNIDDPEKLPSHLKAGSIARIMPELSPQDSDIVINKYASILFIGTHFEYMMRNAGISTIIFTGISTEGVDSNSRDSTARGFYTVVAEDCCSSPRKESHEATLNILRRMVVVASSKEIMKEWH